MWVCISVLQSFSRKLFLEFGLGIIPVGIRNVFCTFILRSLVVVNIKTYTVLYHFSISDLPHHISLRLFPPFLLRFNLAKAVTVLTDYSKIMINIPLAKLKHIKYQWLPLRYCEFKKILLVCLQSLLRKRKYIIMHIVGMCAFPLSY